MLKKIHFIGVVVSVFIIILFSTTSYPQFNDYSTKIGVQFNGLLPDTEFDKEFKVSSGNFKFSYLGRLFFRFELIKQFIETEAGAGYGSYTGVDFNNSEYKTDIIPLDLRFILSPFNIKTINPYGYAGIGILRYKVKTFPKSESPNKTDLKDAGWSTFAPVGCGFEINLSDNLNLDLSGGYTFTFTDNLNYYNNKDAYSGISTVNDGYYQAALGFTFIGGSGNTDKDMDGLIKKIEKEIGTDPENPDTDGDGLKDGEEVNNYKSNPLNADTDGEGLNDGDEVNKYKTDPLKTDTDVDGLYDGEEVMKHKTDPLKKDTDGGSVDDLTEIIRGTNPVDPNDDVVKIGVPIILEGVTFETNKAAITPESSQILRSALKTLTTYPEIQVQVSGCTDNVGSKNANVRLSEIRAEAIREWLIERGIDPVRIVAKGYGPDVPIAPNDSPENKRKNRRIEFKRIK